MLKYLYKNNKKFFSLSLITIFLQSLVLIYIPLQLGVIVDTLVGGNDVDIFALVFQFAVIILLATACGMLKEYFKCKHYVQVMKVLEIDLAKSFLSKRLDISKVTNVFNQEIKSIVNNYLAQYMGIYQTLLWFFIAVAVGAVVSWEIVAYVIIATIITTAVNQLFSKKLSAYFKDFQNKNTTMNKVVQGMFSAVLTLNIFSAQKLAMEKMDNAFEEKKKSSFRYFNLCDTVISQTNNLLGYVAQYGLIIGAYILVFMGRLSIGEAVVLQYLMSYMVSPLKSIMGMKNLIDSSKDLRKDFVDFLAEPSQSNITIEKGGDISFENIDFSYDGNAFINNANLKFKQGERYLILGGSGSGKSTILKLILREISPTSGKITFAGEDISEINTASLYGNIAYCGQNIEIVPGTLQENIVLGYAFDQSKFDAVVEASNIKHLIPKTNTQFSEGLDNFSGGELQRIAIARMLYKDCDIFIFDEFSSALDNENAYTIEKMLLEIKGKMIINVTHRIHEDLTDRYDAVIRIDNGRLV